MSELEQGFVIFTVILAIFAVIAVKCAWDAKNREKKFISQIRASYGQIPQREYRPGEMDSIAVYYRQNSRGKQVIDDITWNDLDMDRIFMALNQTWSSSGEEYLYYMLRTPCLEEDTLKERERLISYFAGHEEERTRLSLAFRKVGKTRGMSAWEYMSRLLDIPDRSSVKDVVQAVLGAVSILSLVIRPTYGVLFFLVMLCVNIGTYYRQMGKDRPYISCFHYVMRLLKQAEILEQTQIPEIREYLEQMSEARLKFRKFQKNSFLLKEGANITGDLMESIMDYFRMFFHLDIIKFNSMLGEFRKHLDDARLLMEQAGILESAIAVASFRELMPCTALPVFKEGRIYRAEGLYHPLIEEPVPNGILAVGSILITGSNASGKSTFLKTAGHQCDSVTDDPHGAGPLL